MVATGRMRPLLGIAMTLCVIGAVDSTLDQAWDQLVLFVATALLIAAAVVVRHPKRRALTLREDLVDWLRSRSELTGEPVETLADRAVAAHRAGLTGLEDPP
jgi:hypothetical protein